MMELIDGGTWKSQVVAATVIKGAVRRSRANYCFRASRNSLVRLEEYQRVVTKHDGMPMEIS